MLFKVGLLSSRQRFNKFPYCTASTVTGAYIVHIFQDFRHIISASLYANLCTLQSIWIIIHPYSAFFNQMKFGIKSFFSLFCTYNQFRTKKIRLYTTLLSQTLKKGDRSYLHAWSKHLFSYKFSVRMSQGCTV